MSFLPTVATNTFRSFAVSILSSPVRFCSAFFPVKSLPILGKTHFQIFYILYGFLEFTSMPKWNKNLIPFFILAMYSIGLGFYNFALIGQYESLLRGFQLLLLIYSCQAMAKYISPKDWSKLFIIWALLSIILYSFELLYTNPVYGRSFYFVMRYMLIVGEPNYSALFFTSLTAVAIGLKKFRWVPFWILFACLTLSRTPFIFYVSCIFLFLSYKIIGHKIKWIAYAFITCTLLHPLFFYLVYKLAPPEYLKNLIQFTTRFYIQPLYFEMFLDYPFGVGLNRGHSFFELYRKASEPFLLNTIGLPFVDSNEQHSIYVQLLTETGLIGYSAFAFFLFRLFNTINQTSILFSIVFVAFLPMLVTLNALNEAGIYYLIAAILFNIIENSSPSYETKMAN